MAMTPTQLELKRQELEAKIAEAKNDVERKKYELELRKYSNEKPFERMAKVGQFVRGMSQLIPGKFRINDPRWYDKCKYVFDISGKISFADPLTDKLELKSLNGASINPGIQNTFGVCVLRFGPTLGGTDVEALKTQQTNLWRVVRGAATGDTNGIGPSNLMDFVLCWDSVLINLSKAARLIALANVPTNPVNRYEPNNIIRALGYDPADIATNKSDYAARYNWFIKQISAYNIPKGMELFTKHRWLCATVIKDRNIKKSQYYVYDCPHSFIWDEANTALKGYLYGRAGANYATVKAWETAVNANPMRLSDLFDVITKQLDAIDLGQSLKLINSEIQRAIDNKRMQAESFSEISPELVMEFICHDEPLLQIKNTRVINFSTDYAANNTFDFTYNQNTDTLIQSRLSQPSRDTFGGTEITEFEYYLLDATQDKPSDDDVMVMTRNIPLFQKDGNGVTIKVCGDIIVYDAAVYSCTFATNPTVNACIHFNSYMSENAVTLNVIAATSEFDWLPIIFVADTDTSTTPITFNSFYVLTELNNFAVPSFKSIEPLHKCAMLSLLMCDQVTVE